MGTTRSKYGDYILNEKHILRGSVTDILWRLNSDIIYFNKI